jgi:hypothetical protein
LFWRKAPSKLIFTKSKFFEEERPGGLYWRFIKT